MKLSRTVLGVSIPAVFRHVSVLGSDGIPPPAPTGLVGQPGDQQLCQDKNSHLVSQIQNVCAQGNLSFPSPNDQYSGVSWGKGNYAYVYLSGSCTPPESLDESDCLAAFYSMCALGDSSGNNVRYFGGGECQEFTITTVTDETYF